MGVFDQSYTRIKILIILIALLFFIGTCEAVFFGSSAPTVYGEFEDQARLDEEYNNPDSWENVACPEGIYGLGCRIAKFFTGVADVLTAVGNAFASFLGTLYGAITFTLYPNIPTWMTTIMAPIMISITMIVIYIIVDITYDIFKALPTT